MTDATGLNASAVTVEFGPQNSLADVTDDTTITDDTVTLDAVGLQNDTTYELSVTLVDDASAANTDTVSRTFSVNAAETDDGTDGGDDGFTLPGVGDGDSDDSDDGGDPVQPPAPQPSPTADISVVEQALTTTEITAGETAAVRVTLANDGDAAGSKTVTLSLDGSEEVAVSYTLDAGATQTVTLYASPESAGEYAVQVEGSTVGTLTVTAATPAGPARPRPASPA